MQLRTVRTVTLDVMRTDYVRTAWPRERRSGESCSGMRFEMV